MKILLTHRYYTPDTPPYAIMLHTIAKALHEAGHDVQVFTAQPSYKTATKTRALKNEELDGVKVRRISVFSENSPTALRALNAVWYCLRLFIAIVRRRPDVVQAASFPPVIAGWTASLAAKLVGAKFVYHVQDVHPEVAVLSGGALGKGLLRRVMQALDNATLRRASAVVVLSNDMKGTLIARGKPIQSKIHIINNFLLEQEDKGELENAVEPMSAGKLNVIFAGNIGIFQGLDAVIEAAHSTRDLPDLHYWFLGDGAYKNKLIEKAGDLIGKTVFLSPFRPASEAVAMISLADIALAPLSPSIYQVSYPSKVLTYLGIGMPIISCVENNSELAQTIEKERIGYHATPGDAVSIAAAFREAWAQRDDLKIAGQRAKALYDDVYSAEQATKLWNKMYKSI